MIASTTIRTILSVHDRLSEEALLTLPYPPFFHSPKEDFGSAESAYSATGTSGFRVSPSRNTMYVAKYI